jgi:hypothetical protein
MLRVTFGDGTSEDYDANAAAPFGMSGVMLSRVETRVVTDPADISRRITQVSNPQLVVILAHYTQIDNLDLDADESAEATFGTGGLA